jgi:hypothetical protein
LTIIPIHAKRMERFEQVSTINVTKWYYKRRFDSANAVCNLPKDKKFISKFKLINDRKHVLKQISWTGPWEHLAYGSLQEDFDVRISGKT